MSNTPPPFFPDIPVLGARSVAEVAEALRAMGDPDADRATVATAGETPRGGLADLFGWGAPKAWQHTAHQLGFIAPAAPGNLAPLPVVHPGMVPADPELRDARINIHLDRLHVQEYPGGGEHLVLVTFRAQNQAAGVAEPVSLGQTYRVRAGQSAGVTGYPLCLGLGVGRTGAAFQFFTVNVKDTADETTLAVLESPTFAAGLNLLTSAQPAVRPLTDLTLGLARQLATRHRNRPVQDCYLGLDFGSAPFGARLAAGSFLAVQVPGDGALRWGEWEYRPADGLVANKANGQPLPFNYLVFRVSKFEE